MKTTTIKYSLSIIFTILFTVLGVKAWVGLTASNGDKLDYQKWNELVSTVQSGIPTGAVMAFNLAGCPNGWSEYTSAVGRTIIGVGNGAGSTTNLGDTGGEKSAPAISFSGNIILKASIGGNIGNDPTGKTLATTSGVSARIYSDAAPTIAMNAASIDFSDITGGGTAPDNMQPYVALLYCVKN